jgi:superoxide dismutase, Cu-Zn family
MQPETIYRAALLALALEGTALADAADAADAAGGTAARDRPVTIQMTDAEERPLGVVVMTSSPGGIAFAFDLHGVPPGDHAVVLHGNPACAAGDAELVTRGPRRRVAGADRPRLAVELPDVTADDGGGVQATIVLADPSLLRALAGRGGGALSVHAGPGPAGDPADPADRIACGAITPRGSSTPARPRRRPGLAAPRRARRSSDPRPRPAGTPPGDRSRASSRTRSAS